jgi:hypothetical protein
MSSPASIPFSWEQILGLIFVFAMLVLLDREAR